MLRLHARRLSPAKPVIDEVREMRNRIRQMESHKRQLRGTYKTLGSMRAFAHGIY